MFYKVKITERSTRYVIIEADDEADAEYKAEDLWTGCKILLDANDFDGIETEAVEEIEPEDIQDGYEVFRK